MWLLGDEFLTKAVGHFLQGKQESDENVFMKNNFDIKWYASNNLDLQKAVIGRLRDQLKKAIKEQKLLPKLIIVILDDNIITNMKSKGYGISEAYGCLIHWAAEKFNHVISSYKDKLPKRCKKEQYPNFVWMAPPQHKNFENNNLRGKFTKSLKSTLGFQSKHMMLKLLKVWQYEDSSLVNENRYTSNGYRDFWLSLDSAIEFWSNNLAPKPKSAIQREQKREHHTSLNQHNDDERFFIRPANFYQDRYHWTPRQKEDRRSLNHHYR